MARKPQIFYDKTCPVCGNYIRMIQKKVPKTEVEYVGVGPEAKEFKYINANGDTFVGEVAIDNLLKDFPAILEYMWMLPSALKKPAAKVAYKVGSSIRRTISKSRGCNCGK